ncbi:MAG: acetolactate decarboxylase [Verrucomicrobia bacterium]|nr:acetolactate decarboxylase [Verrucomicrobiota bacterium]MBU1734760.1 acetolactate decarboxylase [Verrucomicrobiota bacterium]MBU1857779.1 acetolactate decarboxylase [Verrucomicrobiota bacterium]
MSRCQITFLVLTLLAAEAQAAERDAIYQTAPIDALMAGVYDGDYAIGDLKQHGDIGIGTLDALDGELVYVDGQIFQVRADGKVCPVPDSARTPLATVTWLDRDIPLKAVSATNFDEFCHILDRSLPSANLFYAIRADGKFDYVKTRSMSKQQKPYRPLVEVAKEQAVFEFKRVKGTLVGFRCPAFVKGINVPGYHFHFLTDDRKGGGHVLDLRVTGLEVILDTSDSIHLALPKHGDFNNVDLSVDRQQELHRVESSTE